MILTFCEGNTKRTKAKMLMITAVLFSCALSQLSQAAPSDPTKIGDPCKPGKDSVECGYLDENDGHNFCHYKTKKCTPSK